MVAYNTSEQYSGHWLRQTVRSFPILNSLYFRLAPKGLRRHIRTTAAAIDKDGGVPTQLNPDLRAALTTEMLPEIEALESIVGKDLSHWKPNAAKAT